MGHKSVNPGFFFLKIGSLQSPDIPCRWNNILLVYSTFFLQFTCQNIIHLSMSSHRAFMIYKYTYHKCGKKMLLKTPFTKTYKHR
jgi:hypothetical protein